MKALTVQSKRTQSAELREVPEPHHDLGSVLVEAVAVGVCGTDREIIHGEYGAAPPGEDYLIIGHESLGRVIEAPASSGIVAGDLVVGIVRRPDPVPCTSCSVGEWDMCRNEAQSSPGCGTSRAESVPLRGRTRCTAEVMWSFAAKTCTPLRISRLRLASG